MILLYLSGLNMMEGILVFSPEHTLNTLYALECNNTPNSNQKERNNDLINCLSSTWIRTWNTSS